MTRLMRGTVACAAILFVIMPLSVSPSYAQSVIPSNINIVNTPQPGSGHDYIKLLNETVNPANGSLSVRIQAPTPRQRGDVDFPFYVFGYDSGGVAEPSAWLSRVAGNNGAVQTGVNIYWLNSSLITGGNSPNAIGLIPGGFVANAGIGETFFQQTSVNVQLRSDPLLFATCNFNSGYVYIDPFATRHSMNVGWITHSGTSGGDEGCGGAGVSSFNTTWSDADYSIALQGTPYTPSVNADVTDLHGRSQDGGIGEEDTNGNCCGPKGTTTISNIRFHLFRYRALPTRTHSATQMQPELTPHRPT